MSGKFGLRLDASTVMICPLSPSSTTVRPVTDCTTPCISIHRCPALESEGHADDTGVADATIVGAGAAVVAVADGAVVAECDAAAGPPANVAASAGTVAVGAAVTTAFGAADG